MSAQQRVYYLKKNKFYIKGSGNSYCLTNQLNKDQQQFIQLIVGFQPRLIAISGMFIISIDEIANAYLWGTTATQIITKPVILHHNVIGVSCGWDHALLKTSNHALYGFGSNRYLQLGITQKSSLYYDKPILIKEQCQVYAAGFRQSYYSAKGILWGTGQTNKYQLGYQSKSNTQWIQLWHHQQQIRSIICGKRYVFILMSNSQLYGLGYNDHNVFNNPVEYLSIVSRIYNNYQVQQVASGWTHVVLLLQKGQIMSYGRNNFGQLGHSSTTNQVHVPAKISKVVCGTEFTMMISQEGQLFATGWNQHQNLLNDANQCIYIPTKVSIPAPCQQVWTYPAITIMHCK